MRSQRGDLPLSVVGSFWINIHLVYILMPVSGILSHFLGIQVGLWTAYFSFLNAFSHVVMFLIFGRKYNPGLVVSILLNIPFGLYTVYYFISNNLISFKGNILSIILGIIAQASMMIYGFGFLVPRMKREGYALSSKKEEKKTWISGLYIKKITMKI